ncbi:MAG: MarR family transcriptional regulator [Propionicimonas sp.]|nr:MarR family transcriptional regulator [Propionicimonas sp.]
MDEGLRQDERVALARLHALLELLPTALDQRLAPFGVTAFEYALLEALHDADGGRLRLTALASRTNATLPRLSRVVSALERKGLVQRVPCEADGRATNAVLTLAGQAALRTARPAYADAVRSMVLDGLGEGGAATLADVALAILRRLDPDRRLAVTAACEADGVCAADPVPTTAATPA